MASSSKNKSKSSSSRNAPAALSTNLDSFSPAGVERLINSIRLAGRKSSPSTVPRLKQAGSSTMAGLTTSSTALAGSTSPSEAAGSSSTTKEPPVCINLVSSDGEKFRISVKAGEGSGVIKKMMQSGEEEVVLEKYSSEALEPVHCYFSWVDDGRMDQFRVLDTTVEELADGLVTALELEIPGMVGEISGMIAGKMRNKSVEWVRDLFGIVGDLTAKEEAEIQAQYPWAFEGVDQD